MCIASAVQGSIDSLCEGARLALFHWGGVRTDALAGEASMRVGQGISGQLVTESLAVRTCSGFRSQLS